MYDIYIFKGEFDWLKRTRIRTTMLGQNGNLPESFDLQELHPTPMELNDYPTEFLNNVDRKRYRAKVKRILPYLALNEVFIGETQSARVSHIHLQIDEQNQLNKTKSSGLCVSTGTGSSSWLTRFVRETFFLINNSLWIVLFMDLCICCSINRLSTQNVCELIKIIEQNGCKVSKSASEIAEKYNAKIVFDPGEY